MNLRSCIAVTAAVAISTVGLTGCGDETEANYGTDRTDNGLSVQTEPDSAVSLASQPETEPAEGEEIEVTESSGLGALEIQRQLPESIYANQPFQYTLVVKNTSDMTLHDIRLRELYRGQLRPAGQQAQMQQQGQQAPQGQQAQGQQQDMQSQQTAQQQQQQMQQGQIYGFPRTQPMQGGSGAMHQLGMLGPGETAEIQAVAVPTTDGELKLCVLADYAMGNCSSSSGLIT